MKPLHRIGIHRPNNYYTYILTNSRVMTNVRVVMLSIKYDFK